VDVDAQAADERLHGITPIVATASIEPSPTDRNSNPEGEVFIVTFNYEAFLDNGTAFTNDIREMQQALTRIDARGGTALCATL